MFLPKNIYEYIGNPIEDPGPCMVRVCLQQDQYPSNFNLKLTQLCLPTFTSLK